MRGIDGNYGIPTGLKSQCFSVRVRGPLPRMKTMYIEKELDDKNSLFIIAPMLYSKRTKTYPRIRGWFSFQKEDKILYPRFKYLDDRTQIDIDNKNDPLNAKEWSEYRKLQQKFGTSIFYFVFDVKKDKHCVIDYICNYDKYCYEKSSAERIDINGLFWQNEIYKDLMKDKQSLRRLNDKQTKELFNQQFFHNNIMSEYIFSILKV